MKGDTMNIKFHTPLYFHRCSPQKLFKKIHCCSTDGKVLLQAEGEVKVKIRSKGQGLFITVQDRLGSAACHTLVLGPVLHNVFISDLDSSVDSSGE